MLSSLTFKTSLVKGLRAGWRGDVLLVAAFAHAQQQQLQQLQQPQLPSQQPQEAAEKRASEGIDERECKKSRDGASDDEALMKAIEESIEANRMDLTDFD